MKNNAGRPIELKLVMREFFQNELTLNCKLGKTGILLGPISILENHRELL